MSMRALAIRGSIWTLGGYGLSQVIRLGSNVLLAKLLFPEAFGLMALVGVFMQGLQMFSDIGIGPGIIRSHRGDNPTFLNTAWTIQVVRGFLLWLATCALAWPVARMFALNDPAASELTYLLPVVGLASILAGFRSPGLFVLNRSLRIGRLTAWELASAAAGTAAVIVWAWVQPSVWALVGGSLIASAVRTVLSYIFAPEIRVHFRWDRDCASELIGFGKWVFISTVITFLAMRGDRLMLGALVPMGVLGVYSMAVMLAALPGDIMNKMTERVLFPALAHAERGNPNRLAGHVLEARSFLLPAAALALAGVVVLSPAFFEALYDDRYQAAGRMAQLLAVGAWFSILSATSGRALLVVGDSRSLAASNFANLVVTGGGCILGHVVWGMPGFILGYAAGNLAGLVVIDVMMHRRGMPVALQDAAHSLMFAVLAAGGLGLPWLAADWRPSVISQLWWRAGAGILVHLAFGIWTATRIVPRVFRT